MFNRLIVAVPIKPKNQTDFNRKIKYFDNECNGNVIYVVNNCSGITVKNSRSSINNPNLVSRIYFIDGPCTLAQIRIHTLSALIDYCNKYNGSHGVLFDADDEINYTNMCRSLISSRDINCNVVIGNYKVNRYGNIYKYKNDLFEVVDRINSITDYCERFNDYSVFTYVQRFIFSMSIVSNSKFRNDKIIKNHITAKKETQPAAFGEEIITIGYILHNASGIAVFDIPFFTYNKCKELDNDSSNYNKLIKELIHCGEIASKFYNGAQKVAFNRLVEVVNYLKSKGSR